MSYIETDDRENKISAESLNKWDGEMGWELRDLDKGWKDFWGFAVLGESSEKGSTRKYTGKRVTRCGFMFWGNSAVLRWIAKRMILGEVGFGIFFGLAVVPREGTEEGGPLGV
jgi:hypothetical protein